MMHVGTLKLGLSPLLTTLTDGVVTLSTLRGQDAASLVAIDDDWIRRAWGRPYPLTIDLATSLVDEARGRFLVNAPPIYRTFAIREGREDGGLCGIVLVRRLPSDAAAFRVPIFVGPSARRRGIGRRALELAIDYGRRELRVRRVEAEIAVWNSASASLFASVGFTPFSQSYRMGGESFVRWSLDLP